MQAYLKGLIEGSDYVMFYKDFLDYDKQLKEEGRIEGRIEGLITSAINMVKEMKITVTQAMQVVKLPEDTRAYVIEELEKENISYAL